MSFKLRLVAKTKVDDRFLLLYVQLSPSLSLLSALLCSYTFASVDSHFPFSGMLTDFKVLKVFFGKNFFFFNITNYPGDAPYLCKTLLLKKTRGSTIGKR